MGRSINWLKLSLVVSLLLSSLIPLLTISSVVESQNVEPEAPSSSILTELNFSNVLGYVDSLSSIPTRVTGYPGCDQAADYIGQQFRNLGLKVEEQKYKLLVPVDHGANITILSSGTLYEAYTLWPNLIQCSPTPPEGVTGRLIYVGSGSLEEFDGKEVSGSIVLMNFNSMSNWINAAKLGAKAIILVEPEETTRVEAESKVILTPIYFPRVYVKRDVAIALYNLAQNGTVVNLKSSMTYEERTGRNVIGILEGQEITDQIMLLTAHYDSWSPAPSSAQDAQSAVRVASLLELARVLAANPPKRTIWFVAFSGHYECAAGSREFTEQFYFQNQTYASGAKKLLCLADLHLSTEASMLTWDQLQKNGFTDDIFVWWTDTKIRKEYIPALSADVVSHYTDPRDLTANVLTIDTLDLDSGPICNAGPWAFSYITYGSLDETFFAPNKQIDKINLANLAPQLKFILYTFNALVNEDLTKSPMLTSWVSGKRYYYPQGAGATGGAMRTLVGRVDEFNQSSGFYDPVPNAFVVVARITGAAAALGLSFNVGHMSVQRYNPLWGQIIVKADQNGSFEVHGIDGADAASTRRRPYSYSIFAYEINASSGQITRAPDKGMYGGGGGILGGYQFQNIFFEQNIEPVYVKTIVFRCNSITLFDIMNPILMLSPEKGYNEAVGNTVPRPIYNPISVFDFQSHTTPMFWGLISPEDTAEPLAIAFVPQGGTKYEILLSAQAGALGGSVGLTGPSAMSPVGILNNASDINQMGTGLTVTGQAIQSTAFRFLEGIFWLTEARRVTLAGYSVFNEHTDESHRTTATLIGQAKEAFSNKKYSIGYNLIMEAWNTEATAYGEMTSTTHDVINISVAFYFMLIPFAFIMERLVFRARENRRLITVVLTFVIFLVVTYFLHPGFRLASNLIAVILGLSVFVLSLLVLGVIGGQSLTYAKELRAYLTGSHYTEISRGSAVLLAFSLGVSNMRRRRMRTILTMITLITITASFVSLTSASTFSIVNFPSNAGTTPYNGMALMKDLGLTQLPNDILSVISAQIPNATIAKRAWFFPPPGATPSSMMGGLNGQGPIYSEHGKTTFLAILGATAEESELTHIDEALLAGSRWFTEQDMYTCILPKSIASQLNVSIGDFVQYLSLNVRVIGIADEQILSTFVDVSQITIAPILPLAVPAGTVPLPLPWNQVIILPYNLVTQFLDAGTYSIAVKSDNQTAVQNTALGLALGSGGTLGIWAGFKGTVSAYIRGAGLRVVGTQLLIMPFAIAVMVIFTTMLGSLYERLKEIYIYSAVGLSPLHVAGMFLSESITYALIGSVIGYMIGVVGIDLLRYFGAIPSSMTVNLSSSMVFLTMGLSALATLLAALYPIIMASRLVTPSFERRWKIKTKPVGNEWSIPLPFTVGSEEETRGVLAFIREYLNIYTSREIGQFWIREIGEFEKALIDGKIPSFSIPTVVSLPPWDSAFREEMKIIATQEKSDRYAFQIQLKYLGGSNRPWLGQNPNLVDSVRKQLLLWRGIKKEEKELYVTRGRSISFNQTEG